MSRPAVPLLERAGALQPEPARPWAQPGGANERRERGGVCTTAPGAPGLWGGCTDQVAKEAAGFSGTHAAQAEIAL